jgi:nitric oxide reductase subunit B
VTNRPGKSVSYTSNWPSEPLVGNVPTSPTYLWTFVSIFLLIAGVGALVWYHAATSGKEPAPEVPEHDPLTGLSLTPSMRASIKFFVLAVALFLVQVALGGVTAHYAVEGQAFYGFELAQVLPYSLARTWHTQLGVLWIATAWLGTGLFIAPAVSGREPVLQRFGVNFLFLALLVIVVGAFAGQWISVMQQSMSLEMNFWFGHQGWEYVDLGRFWQAFLFVGLMLWLVLVGRALWPALRTPGESRTLTGLLFLSVVAIGLFYGAGLMWGSKTHLAMVEYWRWWVVHLWVEGFFEVFATAVIAFLFTRLGLVRTSTAVNAVLFATVIFLSGGVLGTMHHLYWTGTPTAVLAFGAVFSALEVVPLAVIGFEAYQNYSHVTARPWVATYRWPILFFVAVAFWNLVGAGLFGFLINPPLALYYMQGLNTTPLHGHTALFGVYGMLGIGLMLFCLRLVPVRGAWDEKLIARSFWTLNGGLAAMAVLSLAPVGLLQVKASVEHGFWFARSPEFIHSDLIETLVWMRMPGDILFAAGAAFLALFFLRLFLGRGREKMGAQVAAPEAPAA